MHCGFRGRKLNRLNQAGPLHLSQIRHLLWVRDKFPKYPLPDLLGTIFWPPPRCDLRVKYIGECGKKVNLLKKRKVRGHNILMVCKCRGRRL